jgi:hypothetical protein
MRSSPGSKRNSPAPRCYRRTPSRRRPSTHDSDGRGSRSSLPIPTSRSTRTIPSARCA